MEGSHALPRTTLVAALVTFATINALLWVAGLRLAEQVLGLDLSSALLTIVAAVTAMAVPLAAGIGTLRRGSTG